MIEEYFGAIDLVCEHINIPVKLGVYPDTLNQILSRNQMQAARAEIRQWPGYAPTPLRKFDRLAAELNLGGIYYKDEALRFGLGSFKALGGAYAVLCKIADLLSASSGTLVTPADVRSGKHAAAASEITVVSATAGNHGRSVAWGAQQAGCNCRIYIHSGVDDGRKRALESYGAEVIRVAGDYDDSVPVAAADADANGWHVVSDTSYEGYTECPTNVMAGYSVMGEEALEQLGEGGPPTHIFAQTGCGGLAGGVSAQMWADLDAANPRMIVVEPERAACLAESARRGKLTGVKIEDESIMLGLSCGDVSVIAWDILAEGAGDYLTIPEAASPASMRFLASGIAGGEKIVAGESAAAGLAALIGAARRPDLREALGLNEKSCVMLIGSEGATAPLIYEEIVGHPPEY